MCEVVSKHIALKTHRFPKKRIVFQHVHFFIPLFWNEKLSLHIIIILWADVQGNYMRLFQELMFNAREKRARKNIYRRLLYKYVITLKNIQTPANKVFVNFVSLPNGKKKLHTLNALKK